MHSLECHFGAFFRRGCATQEIDAKQLAYPVRAIVSLFLRPIYVHRAHTHDL